MADFVDSRRAPSLRGNLLPAYFRLLGLVDSLPLTIPTRPRRRLLRSPTPGLRPLVRQIVATHLRSNIALLSRWYNAEAAIGASETEPRSELAALSHAEQVLPQSRWRQWLLAATVVGAAISLAFSAVLPSSARTFISNTWFDALRFDLGAVVAALPSLDGDPSPSLKDLFYFVLVSAVMASAILVPLEVARGSYLVANGLLRGRDHRDLSAPSAPDGATQPSVIDVERGGSPRPLVGRPLDSYRASFYPASSPHRSSSSRCCWLSPVPSSAVPGQASLRGTERA